MQRNLVIATIVIVLFFVLGLVCGILYWFGFAMGGARRKVVVAQSSIESGIYSSNDSRSERR
ncbi:Protein of unknown function [Pyronema omphalodes CBS 100304]|uniref:Uncharacterized protein n=1 Tax=Pyronema omphalodes (strain CBS 100304) TaxID=1076935 RepID=U4KZR0_PYROM|nr:Protein of unknown function [Pyronema omphalodes CBS 100304]